MIRLSVRFGTGVLALSLVVGASAGVAQARSSSAAPRAAQGVSKDQIDMVVLYPDIDALKAKGIQSRSSNEGFLKQFTGYVDAYGPINGRKVNVTGIAWDPIDATSYDKACTAATQDNKPFVVVNDTGYLTSAVACIAIDNKTPMAIGDPASETLRKAAGKNLVLLREPTEIMATNAVDIIAKGKLIPKTAKIGILSNNEPSLKVAGEKLASGLKKKGYDVASTVEINGLSSDLGVISRGAQAAVATFQAAGVDTVIHDQSFSAIRPFFNEAARTQANFKNLAIDAQASMCSPTAEGVGSYSESVGSLECITSWSNKALPDKSGLAPDTAFEAKCREDYDASLGIKSTPGSAGNEEINGVVYDADFPAGSCNLANILLPAIKKAGKNLTWDKVYANIQATKGPAAYMSEGQGEYGKDKPYFPTKLHVLKLNYANQDTPKDANGLFAGCPTPVNCWVPVVSNGQEWYPIKG
jgi:hypothetical protein